MSTIDTIGQFDYFPPQHADICSDKY